MTWDRRHLIDVEELSESDVKRILDLATDIRDDASRSEFNGLSNHDVALLFAEASTRTRLSFELAARQIGGRTYVLDPMTSSMVKGESLVDTVRNLDALGFAFLIIRHHRAGAAAVAARHFSGHVVNAGDGWHAHPTQALLDLFTLQRALGDLRGRKIAIVGDVRHSRVARSNTWTLSRAGAEVVLCGPTAWVRGVDHLPATRSTNLGEALSGADAVMGLRVQKERMAPGVSVAEYVEQFQITEAQLQRHAPHARFLHPGPINMGVEVSRDVALGPRSLVLEQARNGVPVRTAVLSTLVSLEAEGFLSRLGRGLSTTPA